MKPSIQSHARPLLLLIGLLLILALADDYTGWRFLLLGLGGALGLSWLWARSLASGLHLEREMRFGWAQVGDQLEERFTLFNRGLAPALWVEIQDHSTLPGSQASQATGADGGSHSAWHTTVTCTRRGLFTLGPTTLRTADPLGLFSVTLHNPHAVQLMVTPPVVPLPHIEVAPGGKAGQGRPRPNLAERTVSAASVREYVPGDSLRWMHWRTTARRGKPYVRTFESTPSGDWWIILDANRAVQAGQGARSTQEHGVILAASLADRGLRLNRAVGLIASGATARLPESQALAWLPPRQGDFHRYAILRALALLEPGERPLAELLAGLEASLNGPSSLVIITANISGDWLPTLLPLMWKGAIPTLLLLDPAAFDPAKAGDQKSEILNLLTERGIAHQRITPDLLDRPEAQPGRRGRPELKVTPTGGVRVVNPAQDAPWRRL